MRRALSTPREKFRIDRENQAEGGALSEWAPCIRTDLSGILKLSKGLVPFKQGDSGTEADSRKSKDCITLSSGRNTCVLYLLITKLLKAWQWRGCFSVL